MKLRGLRKFILLTSYQNKIINLLSEKTNNARIKRSIVSAHSNDVGRTNQNLVQKWKKQSKTVTGRQDYLSK